MRKARIGVLVVFTVMLVLLVNTALAEKEYMDCPNCGYTEGTYTYSYSRIDVVGDCPYTIDCQIKRRVSVYNWNCDTCGYGSGAHGKDEIYEYHTNSNCKRSRMINAYVRIRNGSNIRIEPLQ